MSIFSTIGSAITGGLSSLWDSAVASVSSHSWTDIIGTGLKVGGSLMSNNAQNKATNAQYAIEQQNAQSQLIQSEAQLRAAAAQQQEGTYKQIEYNRLADEARENASRATINAAQKAYLIRRAGKETAENALAGYAASGVVSGQGSAAYVPAFIVGRAEEDAFSAFQEGKDSADQFTKQAAAYVTAGNQTKAASDTAAAGVREQADALARLSAQTSSIAGQNKSASNTSSTATLLGSLGSIAQQWLS